MTNGATMSVSVGTLGGRLAAPLHTRLTAGQWPEGLSPTQAVPLAATSCVIPFTDYQVGLGTLVTMMEHRDTLIQRLGITPGIEEDTRKALKRRIDSLNYEIHLRTTVIRTGMPLLNPSFLQWKDRNQMPVFAVYEIDSPIARISLNLRPEHETAAFVGIGAMPRGFSLEPDLPPFMKRLYLDRQTRFTIETTAAQDNATLIQFTARYNGSMPDAVCEAIALARKRKLFERIFIITQAPRWEKNVVPRIRIGDPLVVGLHGEELSLIATYDLLPTEALVERLCADGLAAHIRSSN